MLDTDSFSRIHSKKRVGGGAGDLKKSFYIGDDFLFIDLCMKRKIFVFFSRVCVLRFINASRKTGIIIKIKQGLVSKDYTIFHMHAHFQGFMLLNCIISFSRIYVIKLHYIIYVIELHYIILN